MNTQSKDLHGPFLISYGDLHKFVIQCRRRMNLSPTEHELLTCLIHSMNRPGYKTLLWDVVRQESKYWHDMTQMHRQHIWRSFKGLIKKGVIKSIKAEGDSSHYYLSPSFVTAVVTNTFEFVDYVNKSADCNQSGYTTVTNLVTDCNQPDDAGSACVTNLVTDCNQSGYTSSYIEDPSSLNLNPPSVPRSIPTVDNVDNSEESPVSILASVIKDRSLKDASLVISAIEHEKGGPLSIQYVRSFVRWMLTKHVTPVDRNKALLEWYRWEEKIRATHAPQEHFSESLIQ